MTTPATATDTRWRLAGDPVADALVARLRDSPGWHRELAGTQPNRHRPCQRPALAEFFEEHTALPEFARVDQLRRAAVWSQRNLPYLSVSLLCGSLPILFLGARGAAVLTSTKRMTQDVDRRVNETGAFVLDVLAPDALEPDGRAFRGCAEVRLIHALVRSRLSPPDGEVAICQQDLVLTLLAFAVAPIRGARRLGARVRPQDAEDHYALWRALAPVLGVEATLVPDSFTSASRLLDALLEGLSGPSDDGRQLAAALLDGINRHISIPGTADAPAWLVRYLLGDRYADILDLPVPSRAGSSGWARALTSKLLCRLAPTFGASFHRAVVRYKLRGVHKNKPDQAAARQS